MQFTVPHVVGYSLPNIDESARSFNHRAHIYEREALDDVADLEKGIRKLIKVADWQAGTNDLARVNRMAYRTEEMSMQLLIVSFTDLSAEELYDIRNMCFTIALIQYLAGF